MELVDIVDADDNPMGTATRARMRADNLWHRTVAVLCTDVRGRIYLQQRSHEKDLFPGLFDAFVSGCVRAGEGYLETARRELEEELGIRGVEPEPLCKNRYDGPQTRTHTWIYRARWDGPVSHRDGEVIWTGLVTPQALVAKSPTRPLVPDGAAHLQALLARGLI